MDHSKQNIMEVKTELDAALGEFPHLTTGYSPYEPQALLVNNHHGEVIYIVFPTRVIAWGYDDESGIWIDRWIKYGEPKDTIQAIVNELSEQTKGRVVA